jgi:tRNA(Ile)-lysidine synthetase-like protein
VIREITRLESLDADHVALVASRHPATAEVAGRLADHLRPGTRVLIAVSGGTDSLALTAILLALHRRRRPAMLEPIVAHVDHGLRNTSHREAAFVLGLAERIGLAAVVRRLEWPSEMTRVSSDQAREARWEALDALAAETDTAAILTAHHAEDQAETVLMRIARGTGLRGLAGIPAARPTPGGRLVLRPLLRRSRAELADLVRAAGLPWVDDPTNDDRRRTRERLRHEIIPALEAIHPGAARHLAALAEECAADEPPTTRLPESDSIDRTVARRWSEATLATHLRTLASRTATHPPTSVPRDVWRRAASMVLDDETRPRRLRIDSTLTLVVHRNQATFEPLLDSSSTPDPPREPDR